MCGIAGILSFNNSVPFQNIKFMTQAMHHRGPDDEGFAFFNSKTHKYNIFGGADTPTNVFKSNLSFTPNNQFGGNLPPDTVLAFGHRRLSIIDLSPSGHQPMCTQDQRYWIIYNGEIYNYLELRKELIKKGYTFQSESDTEVLLYAYIHWGVKAIERFVGMFAFAIYDMVKNTLFLARDFFGIKPLYYTSWPGGFAFASEIKALLCLPNIKRVANPQKVYDYLRFGMTDHGSETLFSNIYQLPAAHYLLISVDKSLIGEPVQYWDIDLDQKVDLSFSEAANKVRELFLKNIELHLRSDVTVGAALSGGIDSSSIMMSMRHILCNGSNLHAFSYIADDPIINEEKWIDIIGQAANAYVHKVLLSADELTTDLENLISIHDEPFGSISIYAQYRVMQSAKQAGIKVMLDGQGADEILGGYGYFWTARLANLLSSLRWVKALHFVQSAKQSVGESWQWIFINAGKLLLPQRLQNFARTFVNAELDPSWLNGNWFIERCVVFGSQNKKNNKFNLMHSEMYKSLMKYGLISLLRYEDRNSMAHSIESRVPFLTPDFVNLLFSLPEEYIIDFKGTRKAIFRKAMRGIVPNIVLDRKDKIGFATSEQMLLSSLKPWVESTISSNTARNIPVINSRKINEKWQQISNSPKSFGFTAWRWLNFIRWVEHFNVSF